MENQEAQENQEVPVEMVEMPTPVSVKSALNAWRDAPSSKKRWDAVLEAAEWSPHFIVDGTALFKIVTEPYRCRGFGLIASNYGKWMVRARRFNKKHKAWNRTTVPFLHEKI